MKKIITFAFSALLASSAAFAQFDGRAEIITGEELPDSLKYVLPDFATGRIIYKDGAYSNGKFNIGTIDQVIRFIDTDGSEKIINNNSQVDRLIVGKNLLLHCGEKYLGIVDAIDDIYFCALRNVTLLSGVKTGAYGMESQTTNVKNISSFHSEDNMQTYDLTKAIKVPFRYSVTPFLYRNGSYWPFTLGRLKKLFPAKKDLIDSWCSQNEIDPTNVEQAKALFEYLK